MDVEDLYKNEMTLKFIDHSRQTTKRVIERVNATDGKREGEASLNLANRAPEAQSSQSCAAGDHEETRC